MVTVQSVQVLFLGRIETLLQPAFDLLLFNLIPARVRPRRRHTSPGQQDSDDSQRAQYAVTMNPFLHRYYRIDLVSSLKIKLPNNETCTGQCRWPCASTRDAVSGRLSFCQSSMERRMELPILEYQPTHHTKMNPQISNRVCHLAPFNWRPKCRAANDNHIKGVSRTVAPL